MKTYGKKINLLALVFFSSVVLFLFQNATVFLQQPNCSTGTNISPLGWSNFPKLYFTNESLGRAVACSREDLRLELISSSAKFYSSILKSKMIERDIVSTIGVNVENFYSQAVGRGTASPNLPYTVLSPIVHPGFPGDARLVQRLSAAALFVDPTTAAKYRDVSRRILLHWAKNTFKSDSEAAALQEAKEDGNFGLSIGSSMTAFAFGYDLLAAGQGIPSDEERKLVEDWFRRVARFIVVSNNSWLQSCVDGVAFDYDGKSCERAMGDNHVTVATAATYALAIMTDDALLAKRALSNTEAHKWGYQDRLSSIIYNVGQKTARQDRFPEVHTGEIYDRWRGHYIERVRALQLHRSMAYPYLNLTFLTAQALMAKRQGVNLLAPVQKPNGTSISLAKAFLFYKIFLSAYDPGLVIDPSIPKVGLGSNYLSGIQSISNYISLDDTYCVNGFAADNTDKNCVDAAQKGFVYENTNQAFTQGYYHIIFTGAYYLLNETDKITQRNIADVIAPGKMRFAENAFSGHIVPMEPALLVEK